MSEVSRNGAIVPIMQQHKMIKKVDVLGPGQTDLTFHLIFVEQMLGEMLDQFRHPVRLALYVA